MVQLIKDTHVLPLDPQQLHVLFIVGDKLYVLLFLDLVLELGIISGGLSQRDSHVDGDMRPHQDPLYVDSNVIEALVECLHDIMSQLLPDISDPDHISFPNVISDGFFTLLF